jgi:hypothetical protein
MPWRARAGPQQPCRGYAQRVGSKKKGNAESYSITSWELKEMKKEFLPTEWLAAFQEQE